jgi:ribonuclease HII
VARRWRPFERELRETVGPLIAGVDEVGRGPLAGPVVACAVVMPPEGRVIPGIDDSKRLDPAERMRLARLIRGRAVALAVGAASVREIDRLNIYHATVLAMRRAIGRLGVVPDHVLLDGKPMRTLPVRHTAIVGGDGCCYSIACASIVAKVTRDRLMRALAGRHPGYGWERNAGYATARHLAGLAEHGASAHHRRSFLPVRQLDLALESPGSLSETDVLEALVEGDPADAVVLGEALEDALDRTMDRPMVAPPLGERERPLARPDARAR